MVTPILNIDSKWYPDSGASNHVTNDFSNLLVSTPCTNDSRVLVCLFIILVLPNLFHLKLNPLTFVTCYMLIVLQRISLALANLLKTMMFSLSFTILFVL